MSDIAFCRTEALTRAYGAHVALRDCTLTVAAGEAVGLAGPNGAGKSTLARMLAGFLQPTSGRVEVGGMEPAGFRESHGIGYLPEEPARLPKVTPADLLALRDVPRDAALTAGRLVEMLGMRAYLHRPLPTLSKGQARAAFTAYALLGPSRLVILDEPDSGLDPDALDRLQAAIRAAADAGAAVLVLSHQLPEMEAACDRMLVIRGGRLVAQHDRDTLQTVGARELYRRSAAR